MGEFVKKTIMGYKEVAGGYSDPECTHVILTLSEYKKIVREKDEAVRVASMERENAAKKIKEAQSGAAYLLHQEKTRMDHEIYGLQEELERAQQEVAYQRELNRNLLRISRERANAERGLKPKKEHTGYVVINMREKELQRKDRRGYYYTITLWETVLQSPYSVEFTEEQARYQIYEDLMKHEERELWPLSRIGIREEPDSERCSEREYEEIMKRENVLLSYQLRANYQAKRMGKTGFWEIVLVHQKPILQIPKDMRP